MNKYITISIISVVILIAVFTLFNGEQAPLISQNKQKNDISLESSETDNPGIQKYVEFSESELNKSTDKRRVLFFYASWCPTCRPADKSFKQNEANIPDDVVVLRVNYNDPSTDQMEKDLAKKYTVTYQHTFVQIDSKGNQVNLWNGGEFEELLENLK